MTNHKAAAERLLPAQGEAMLPNHIAAATAHATLYLAEQQRIANLIAYGDYDARDEIRAGLGLSTTTSDF